MGPEREFGPATGSPQCVGLCAKPAIIELRECSKPAENVGRGRTGGRSGAGIQRSPGSIAYWGVPASVSRSLHSGVSPKGFLISPATKRDTSAMPRWSSRPKGYRGKLRPLSKPQLGWQTRSSLGHLPCSQDNAGPGNGAQEKIRVEGALSCSQEKARRMAGLRLQS
jgi:hypothetical protein